MTRGAYRFLRRAAAAVAFLIAGLAGIIATTPKSEAYTENFGVYGTRWAEWVKHNHHLTGFYVYQLYRRTSPKDATTFREVAATGIETIGMQVIHPSVKERFMRKGRAPDVPVPQVVEQIVSNLSDTSFDAIRIISIDEENFWWNGRDRYLADIYTQLKPRLPGRQLWQWFNDNQRFRAPVEDRYRVPADGYFADMYSVPLSEYENRLVGYVRQNKPIISTLWASPNWKHGSRREGRLPNWWNDEGWRIFFTKAMINRRYGVRTALFMYDLPFNEPGIALTPNYLSEDPCARAFTKKLFTVTLPRLGTLPLDTPIPTTRPDWMAERCPAP